jgi:hypothetical protein
VPDGFIEIAPGVPIAQALHHTASPDTAAIHAPNLERPASFSAASKLFAFA